MSKKIQLTPTELLSQANEMDSIVNDMANLFSAVDSELKLINSNWSANLSNNFSRKITSTKKTLGDLVNTISEGSSIVKLSAKSFESVDKLLSTAYSNIATAVENVVQNIIEDVNNLTRLDVEEYCEKVSPAEYARLCKLAYDAIKKDNPEEALVELLKNDSYLPDNDPIKNTSLAQVEVYTSDTGFSAFTIADGDNVIVIFVGTNGDIGDFIADAELAIGATSLQSMQANTLVSQLTKKYDNVVVTGHSLGGYLATSTTLHNSGVSKCVSFEAPGRYDTGVQKIFNNERFNKIDTYNAEGSLISKVGSPVGDVETIPVKESGGAISHNHSIANLCDALGGKKRIQNTWD